MRTTIKSGKIILDENGSQALRKMLEVLSNESLYIKVNPSKLASWVISRFGAEYFLSDKKAAVDAHFDRRAYLKSLIEKSDGGDESIQEIQQATANLLKPTRQKRRKENDPSKNFGSRAPKEGSSKKDTEKGGSVEISNNSLESHV